MSEERKAQDTANGDLKSEGLEGVSRFF